MIDPVKALKALADPHRLRIISLLAGGDELCVCEFVDVLQMPQYAVSRHLAALRNAGLVIDRRGGQWVYYRLAPDLDAFAERLVEAVRLLDVSDDAARLNQRLAVRRGGCCVIGYRAQAKNTEE